MDGENEQQPEVDPIKPNIITMEETSPAKVSAPPAEQTKQHEPVETPTPSVGYRQRISNFYSNHKIAILIGIVILLIFIVVMYMYIRNKKKIAEDKKEDKSVAPPFTPPPEPNPVVKPDLAKLRQAHEQRRQQQVRINDVPQYEQPRPVQPQPQPPPQPVVQPPPPVVQQPEVQQEKNDELEKLINELDSDK